MRQRSARVTLLARTASKLSAAVAELEALSGSTPAGQRQRFQSYPADVTSADQVNLREGNLILGLNFRA